VSTKPGRLFDDLDPPRPDSAAASSRQIVLEPQPGRPLSKIQRAFNRLIARVETLRARLDATTRQLDEALVYRAAHIRPCEQRLLDRRKAVVRALWPYVTDRRLRNRDRAVLADLLQTQINEIVGRETSVDDDLQRIFRDLNGIDLKQAQQEELDEARAGMEAMFADIGIDLDMSELRPDMSEEDIAARTAQMADEIRRQAEEQDRSRRGRGPRTKRERQEQQRLERMEEMRRTSIGAIYRRLAKVLHPDLEPDADLRQRKSAMMQELTAAYARRDLHTLLRLELVWIHGEQRDVASLTDEKLDAYNQVLKEQVAALEEAIAEVPFHPKYVELTQSLGPFASGADLNGPDEVRRLEVQIASLESTLARLESPNPIATVRELIQVYRRTQANVDRIFGPGRL
jgi:hypothetical protein